MSSIELKLMDILALRSSIDELTRSKTIDTPGKTVLPGLSGETTQEEAIDAGTLLETLLKALNNAAHNLNAKGISLAKEPIEIKLTGSLVGISPDADRILMKVKPEK